MSRKNKRNREPNRAYGKIQSLPADIREAVDEMLRLNYRYREIVDFIHDNTGVEVDNSMVCRYARRLNANLKEIRLAQENMRVMMEEINRYPELDSAEIIVRLLKNRVLEAINNSSIEEWRGIDPLELLDKSAKLMRVATYKKDVDNKIKSITDIAIDSLKTDMADMPVKDPALYKKLIEYLKQNAEAQ
ncbi:MAG: DUF3486 family protein [Oscillospiraceae bacterium]|nr:DUF3486 family protein [Oscillospiraceae bacterium]